MLILLGVLSLGVYN